MGWIKVERSIMENFLWEDRPFSKGQAWVDLLLLANHKDGRMIYKNRILKTKRGDVNRSVSWLANRWGWGWTKTREFLGLLESEGMIKTSAGKHRTTITIENYAKYQNQQGTDGRTKREQGENKARTRRDIQEGKEGKNIILKNNNRPTLTEIEDFIEENGYAVNAAEFYDYYSVQDWKRANGQRVKDWRACVRSWNRKAEKASGIDAESKKARAKALEELREAEARMVEEANAKLAERGIE